MLPIYFGFMWIELSKRKTMMVENKCIECAYLIPVYYHYYFDDTLRVQTIYI